MSPEEILYLAAASEYGLCIGVSNPISAQQILSTTKSKLEDPFIAGLRILSSPLEPGQLWLVPGAKLEERKAKLEVTKEPGKNGAA